MINNNSTIMRNFILVITLFGLGACALIPDYSDSIVLLDAAKGVNYASEEEVESCEKVDITIVGGAKATNVKEAVSLAMIDARNQALNYSGNRLVYLDTKYSGFFGKAYIGIKSSLYKCAQKSKSVAGSISATATAQIEAQQQASAQAAALAAMQQAEFQSMMAAQQQQALQRAQQDMQKAQQSYNSFKF